MDQPSTHPAAGTAPEPQESRSVGRPAHRPSKDQREQVRIAAGGGMPHHAIALVIGISTPTLLKHYADELSIGAFTERMAVLAALRGSALKGNVSAAKAYLANEPHMALPPGDAGSDAAPADEEPVAVPMGKKEQAAADAKTAAKGTEWEELLGGRKVVPFQR